MDKVYHFSAPGRTEIGGNHTDHQHGCVIAAAVDMETTAEVTLNGANIIRVDSEGYRPVEIGLGDLNAKESERNTTAALIRGVAAAAFAQRGYKLAGFDAKVKSTVLPGSGLSSSAAFEVLIGRILNGLFADNAVSAIEIAQIGQYAENVYYGKPSGLMDQMASSVGGLVFIDFNDPKMPVVEKVDYDFAHSGYTLCTIDSGADHADLTDEYAAMPIEMKKGRGVFRERSPARGGRAGILREDRGRAEADRRPRGAARHPLLQRKPARAASGAGAENDHFDAFLRYVNESGMASWTLLQNVTPAGYVEKQDMGK